MSTVTFASSTEQSDIDLPSKSQQEYVIQPDTKENAIKKNSTPVTIDDVDILMEKQTQAIIAGDSKLAEKISDELDSIGVKKVSFEEILALTDGEKTYDTDIEIKAQSDITFRTAYSYITVSGSRVDIMRVYATPKPGAYMYHEGIVDKDVSKSGTATALELIRIWGEYGAGFTRIGNVVSVYTGLRDSISTLQPTSPITRVRADYNFTCAENTVFLYYWNDFMQNWSHMGNSSYLGYGVTNTTKTCYISGYNALPQHKSTDYNNSLYSANYNDAYYMYTNRGPGEVLTDSQFKEFDIAGVSGKGSPYVQLSLLQPHIPALCK